MFVLFTVALAGDLTTGTERQQLAIDRCLAHWKEHPFGEKPAFKDASPTVRVLQRGDVQKMDSPTETPQLVYIEPNVNVLSRVTYELVNPNGWYCFNNNVDVLSKIRFKMHCDAKLASSRDGATVLAADDVDKGTTVLGSVRFERACLTGDEPEAQPEKPKYHYPSSK